MRYRFTILILLLALAGAATFGIMQCDDDWCLVFEWQRIAAADSYERCVALRFPVLESNPPQCRAGTKSFTGPLGGGITTPPATISPSTMIRITAPARNALVQSPLTVRGEARGNWYFEASFPVHLYDGNGKEIAVVPAQAQGEWMTTNFVPFEGTLTFTLPPTATGTLIFRKDNPSGLPEHDASVSIPVRFR